MTVQASQECSTWLISPDEVDARYKLSPLRQQELRRDGGGPRYFKIGRSVFYRAKDIEAWLETKAVGVPSPVPSSDPKTLSAAFIEVLRPLAKEAADVLSDPPPEWGRLSDAGKLLDLIGLLAERIAIEAEGSAA